MALSVPGVEELKLEVEQLRIPFIINTHTTVASINAYAQYGQFAQFFCHDDGQAIPSDAGFATSDLSNVAGSGIIGVYLNLGDVANLYEMRLDATSIVLVTATGWTGNTYTRKGASSTGVTTGFNASFLMTTTSLDLHAAIGTASGLLNVTYRKKQPGH